MSLKIYLLKHCRYLARAMQQGLRRRSGKRTDWDQRGFSMLELILYAAIVGVLISVAVPKYNNAMASANTARVQSDLQTIDSAIAMYEAETGKTPDKVDKLTDYIVNAAGVKPPSSGNVYINGEIKAIPAAAYSISTDTAGETRAELGGFKVSDYSKEKAASTEEA